MTNSPISANDAADAATAVSAIPSAGADLQRREDAIERNRTDQSQVERSLNKAEADVRRQYNLRTAGDPDRMAHERAKRSAK